MTAKILSVQYKSCLACHHVKACLRHTCKMSGKPFQTFWLKKQHGLWGTHGHACSREGLQTPLYAVPYFADPGSSPLILLLEKFGTWHNQVLISGQIPSRYHRWCISAVKTCWWRQTLIEIRPTSGTLRLQRSVFF